MTLHILPDLIQGSDEWMDQRRGIMTASVVGNLITTRKLTATDYDCPACEAPATEPCRSKTKPGATIKTMHTERADNARANPRTILETASNDNARSLTLLLAAERITGWTDPTYINDDMWRGSFDEPLARAVYAKHFAPVEENGFMIEDKWGFRLGYSPDGLVGEDGLIEIKSRRPKNQVQTVISGHPPIETMAQLQCGLLVSGRKWIDYVSYAGGMHLWPHRVYPDQKWFAAIIAAVRAFEANVTEMLRLYAEGVEGLPLTERIVEQEIVI